jgi:hypothetical protein
MSTNKGANGPSLHPLMAGLGGLCFARIGQGGSTPARQCRLHPPRRRRVSYRPSQTPVFAFEAAVVELVGLEGLRQFPTGLRDGLWCNAHMWHGMGLDAELAAVKFVVEVVERFHPGLVAK